MKSNSVQTLSIILSLVLISLRIGRCVLNGGDVVKKWGWEQSVSRPSRSDVLERWQLGVSAQLINQQWTLLVHTIDCRYDPHRVIEQNKKKHSEMKEVPLWSHTPPTDPTAHRFGVTQRRGWRYQWWCYYRVHSINQWTQRTADFLLAGFCTKPGKQFSMPAEEIKTRHKSYYSWAPHGFT